MKRIYKTEKRFGGEKGIWTAAPEVELDLIVKDGEVKRLKFDFSKDDLKYIDIKFLEHYNKFEGAVQENKPKIGPVDYRGYLLAS